MCGQPVSTAEGRVLRPKDSERLILYFKDLNLPKPDKYETIQLISFLQQLITFRGYYDENNEFIRLEAGRIQIVGSMNASTTVGRHALTSRFTAVVRVACCTYPERTQLQVTSSSSPNPNPFIVEAPSGIAPHRNTALLLALSSIKLITQRKKRLIRSDPGRDA